MRLSVPEMYRAFRRCGMRYTVLGAVDSASLPGFRERLDKHRARVSNATKRDD